jgi:hypothetical protein
MDNFEKMGNNSTGEFKQFLDKNMVNNQKLFEEEINILKQSQQYLNDRDDYKENDLSFENEETKIIKDNSAIKNQVKMDIKINNIMNKNNRMKNSNINSKKNLKIEKENNINNKEVNGEIERSLYKNNNDFIDDINIKRTSQILSTNITTNRTNSSKSVSVNRLAWTWFKSYQFYCKWYQIFNNSNSKSFADNWYKCFKSVSIN